MKTNSATSARRLRVPPGLALRPVEFHPPTTAITSPKVRSNRTTAKGAVDLIVNHDATVHA
jgi:hypothetical protein